MTVLEVLGILGTLAGGAGWVAAYYARGEALRARYVQFRALELQHDAERTSDARRREVVDAQRETSAVRARVREAEHEARLARDAIARVKEERDHAHALLSAAGVPIGGVLLDVALERLRAHADRREADPGGGAGSDGGDRAVPGDAAGPRTPPDSG